MQYGYIKKWDALKGYGFIVSDDDEDLFFHVQDLDPSVHENEFKEGQRVGFDVRQEMKGDRAINVRIIR